MQPQMLIEDFVYGIPVPDSVEWLLQRLLQCYGTMGTTTSDERPSPAETVLHVELDGFHYTLTRTWTETSSTKYRLSPREQEIVRLVAKGFPNKSIATILNISPCTVATHIRRIFDKLDAKSRAEMVARVLEYKL
jgi:two-component system nitrate/nitrite response regulator NarL